ncbi:MAG TPA: DinB family protein [Terriglobales bacterium]
MKPTRVIYLFLAASMALPALGQSKPAAPAATPAPPPPTIASAADNQVSILEREIVGTAEAMPEDKYNFAPSGLNIPGSDFKGVRTFAEQVKHVAATNYLLWGAVTGDKSPVESKDDNGPASLKTKAEIVKYLKDSYAIGHKAAKTLTPENAASTYASPFGGSQPIPRLFMVTFGVAHGFDHYGQMVEYLRMNGIIPPASRGGN